MSAAINHVHFFISCVSNEFGSYRDALRKDLTRPNVTVKVQEDFVAFGAETLAKLDEYIRGCDAVIHIVGDMTGSMAMKPSVEYLNRRYPDFAQRFPVLQQYLSGEKELSYTQWEAYMALYHRKTLIIATPHSSAVRDGGFVMEAGQYQYQKEHLKNLETVERFPEVVSFENCDVLVKNIALGKLLDILAGIASVAPDNLPFHSIGSLFKGREADMERVHSMLAETGKDAHIAAVAVHGLGGTGKTRFAVEYAWRHKQEYTGTLYASAETPERLFTGIAALCGPLALNLDDTREEAVRYNAAIKWLREHEGWLLVLDNADTQEAKHAVEELMAQMRGGQVLITCRWTKWNNYIKKIQLGILEEEAAISYLLEKTDADRRKTDEDAALAKTIVNELGRLALALEQAGGYICATHSTLKKYIAIWEASHDRALQWYDKNEMEYPRSLAAALQISFDRLSDDAKILLNRLSLLAPDPIPESLLEVEVPDAPPIDAIAALAGLERYSLITRSQDKQEFTIHRLVQEVTRNSRGKEYEKEIVQQTLEWVNKAFINGSLDVRNWPVLEPLLPHATTIVARADKMSIFTVTSRLYNQIGLLLEAKAQFTEAEPMIRRALIIDETSYGESHPEVAIKLNNLAQLLKATNRFEKAEPMMRRVLAIDEENYGDDHPDVAIDLNNLAQLLKATNRPEEAEPMMRRALAIDEKSFGKEHPNVAIDLNNLAQLLQATNRLEEAEPMMRRALAINEKIFGEEHPHVAIKLSNTV